MNDALLNASLEILTARARAHRERRARGLGRRPVYRLDVDEATSPPTADDWTQAFADVLRQELRAGEIADADELRGRFDELREHYLRQPGLEPHQAAALSAADWPAIVDRLGGRA